MTRSRHRRRPAAPALRGRSAAGPSGSPGATSRARRRRGAQRAGRDRADRRLPRRRDRGRPAGGSRRRCPRAPSSWTSGTASDGRTVVTGVVPAAEPDVLAELQRAYPAAGLTLTEGETEERDAESNFTGRGRAGRWGIRELTDCAPAATRIDLVVGGADPPPCHPPPGSGQPVAAGPAARSAAAGSTGRRRRRPAAGRPAERRRAGERAMIQAAEPARASATCSVLPSGRCATTSGRLASRPAVRQSPGVVRAASASSRSAAVRATWHRPCAASWPPVPRAPARTARAGR